MTQDPLDEVRQRFAGRPQGELKREDFTPERIAGYAKLVAQAGLGYSFLSEEEREANRAAFLSEHPPGTDLWVFGYGSLMWNPAIETAEARPARITGFHRSFSLTLAFGRATPDRPGLMLVLLDGGAACAGVAHRIAADRVDSETRILWLREMLSGAYRPVWTEIALPGAMARGLVFVANAGHPRLEPGLDFETTARRIAAAEGERGANRDYLFQCAQALAAHGLQDELIARLDARVRAILAEAATAT